MLTSVQSVSLQPKSPIVLKEIAKEIPMKMLAFLLAIIAAIAAVMYYTMPAGSLPTFMPGYAAGSDHIHTTHAIACAVGAVVLFGIGWILGRR